MELSDLTIDHIAHSAICDLVAEGWGGVGDFGALHELCDANMLATDVADVYCSYTGVDDLVVMPLWQEVVHRWLQQNRERLDAGLPALETPKRIHLIWRSDYELLLRRWEQGDRRSSPRAPQASDVAEILLGD
ncbi:hypothetical protein MUG78_17540 [Gordonia alkaliphila]|uniref:hypothetical protein n=1 Tax=Gordonia alkaliphila TaxID=1053547 RepID=UPI001FF315D3|nr:hypothetical protein [Gordonia alkaliphila]MCK0441205.1 hypothetical protein [Gordonia alkaliphila]